MPYSDCVSPKSRWMSCPAACAPTMAAESAASGAELTSVFHGLSGGSTGQPPTIGPLVTTKGALVEHERPRQARSRWRPWARRLRRLTCVLRWRAVAMRRPSTDSVCGSRPVTCTISVPWGRTPTGATRTAAGAAGAAASSASAAATTGGRAGRTPRQASGRSGCPRPGPARAQRVDAAEEAPQEPDRLLGALDLRDVAAVLEDDLLGVGQPLGDVALEAGRDEPVAGAPHEERGRLELGQARVEAPAPEGPLEIDVARRGEEGQPCPRARVDALELVDDEVGHARVDLVGIGEQAPELARDPAAAEVVREQAELRTHEAHDRVPVALDEGHGGREERQAGDPLGRAQAHLDRHPAAHRVADQVGAPDVQRVHHLDRGVGEPASRVRAGEGLGGAAEAGQVERVDAVARARQRCGGVEERRLGRAQPVDAHDVRAYAHRQRRDAAPGQLDVVDAHQRRAPVGQAEQALEADGQVHVAAGVEPALPEGVDARELALAQGQPRLRVGPDDDIGLTARGALAHARAVGRAAHLPRAPHVAQTDVVGGVEALRGAEIALGQRREGLVEVREAPGLGQLAGHGRRPYTRARPSRRWPSVLSAPCVDWGAMAREIRLHDTRTGRKQPLEPRDPGRVGIYSCGPTVYNRIHIGNARPYVVPSLFKRFLEHEGYETTLVANVTDINDKIYDAARPLGVPSADLAREMTAHYFADTEGLGLGRPDREPLASETIEPIKDLIQALLDNGSAYAVDGDVYFRVRADPDYGSLSHRSVDDMDQGEGGEGSDRKEDPLDFALWKAQKEGEDTAWDAPWGRGRPGWHIECSAMAEQLLGVGFEVHTGGNDLTFPHHENEAAQTRRARGAELSRIWMHNGMLQMGGEKMAKSVGNITSLADALAEHGRDAVMMFFVWGHYRQPIQFDETTMAQAAANVRRVREAARRLAPGPSPRELAWLKDRFFEALADDFNTPTALARVFDWIKEANKREPGTGDADLREMLTILGLENLLDRAAGDGEPDADALALLERRETARAARDFAEADRLRDELAGHGWQVRDSADGPQLVPIER